MWEYFVHTQIRYTYTYTHELGTAANYLYREYDMVTKNDFIKWI